MIQEAEIKRRKLVFALSISDDLGVILEPFVVDLTKTDEFSLSFRKVNINTITDYGLILADKEIELIQIMDEYSDENIVKTFSKKKLKPKEFYKQMNKDKFERVIRPYIETRLFKCLDIFKQASDVDLYYKGKRNDAINDKPVKIYSEPALAVFNFIRENGKTRYYLTIKQLDREITLTNKRHLFITHKPCWLLLNNCIYSFRDKVDSKKLIPFFTKDHIEIPANSEKKYYESFILNTIKQFNVNASGFNISELTPQGKAVLKLDNEVLDEPVVSLMFYYDKAKFWSNDKTLNKVFLDKNNNEYNFFKIQRDIDWEKQIHGFLDELGLIPKQGANFILANGESNKNKLHTLIQWLSNYQDELRAKRIEISQKEDVGKYHIGNVEVDFEINKNRDWFDVYGMVKFNGYEIPFISLRENILKGKREFLLPDGSIALIPEEWFKKYEGLLNFGQTKNDILKVRNFHFTLVEDLGKQFVENQLDAYKKLDTSNIKLQQVPPMLNAKLRPYQLQGFSWMYYLRENNLGGCLADDMGLGKTLQVLALLTKCKQEVDEKKQQKEVDEKFQERTSLIVMPLSLIHNWENEIKKFAPELKVFKYIGYNRLQKPEYFCKYDIILTTYGIIRNDIDVLNTFRFYYVILDESQAVKNPGSKIFNTVKKINSENRLILTGTPVENSLVDLWSQMSFLNNGLLGSLNFFKHYFSSPIERTNDEEKKIQLHRIIEPFILRRTKKNVAKDLPDLSTKIQYCEMSDEQRKLYEEEKSTIRNMILENLEKQGKEKSSFIILNGLMRLRLLSNHPSLIKNTEVKESGKFNEIIHSINKLISEDHKVLIYSSFVKHLDLFKKYFDEKDIKYSYLTGTVNEKQRKAKIKDFQNLEDIRVFLISIKAGGTGLNLTSADYVFIIDPWWNPAVEAQAINRTHRIGQKKNIMAYKFIAKDSIEEKIIRLQEEKSFLTEEMMNNKNPFNNISEEEIKELFE
jgi:superfamily II DNA or RNA helicase